MGRGNSRQGDRARFVVRMAALAAALPRGRHAFSEWMGELGVDDEDRADLEVVFSELATNAITAAGDPDAVVEASAALYGGVVTLEICNAAGDAGEVSRRWDMADQLRKGGRGLVIVRAFVDGIEVDRSRHGGVLIRCRRRVTLVPA